MTQTKSGLSACLLGTWRRCTSAEASLEELLLLLDGSIFLYKSFVKVVAGFSRSNGANTETFLKKQNKNKTNKQIGIEDSRKKKGRFSL